LQIARDSLKPIAPEISARADQTIQLQPSLEIELSSIKLDFMWISASLLPLRIATLRTDRQNGGRGGIRTPDTLSGTPVFKTGAINHSATLPYLKFSTQQARNAKNDQSL
jgi:hypothetical protein